MKQKDICTYVSVDFSQIKKEETKILKMIQNAKEEERLASERSYLVYEVILQPIQGEERAHDKDGP